ncbi:MAG TPA: phosphoglycerate mutase family protein [Actinomycetota bacterium]|nr:phosphoglycerate mutase family protein [Actinomycetota bacterium]
MLLVRHAHAGDKATWTGPDRLRPLSPSGRLQAEGLVARLRDHPVERILSSPTLRCHQTVEPLAADRRLRIEPVPALGVDATPEQLLGVVWDLRLRNSVLCTHGEAIGLLLTRLLADVLVADDPLDWPKGSTWLLDPIGGREVRGRFLATHLHDGAPTLVSVDAER